ncbi:hypothetical protein ACSBR2_029925 [Camellia fascicularis]
MLGIALNQFNGILSASFWNLSTSLQWLEAFGCKLKGEIPIGIGNLSSLNVISLDDNKFTGFIPATIGRLESLERLYLEHNRLQGTIPNELSFVWIRCRKVNMGVPIRVDSMTHSWIGFSYQELVQATNAFSESNLLGTSSFGSVYKGTLSDRMSVAIKRLNIMIDVALAMEYLHHSLTTPIVHCDLKPDNVLLDEDMVAHVGDFGIAKLFGEGKCIAQTKTLATIGYMAPEYGMEGIVSTKGDVYSYGIMLMEVFTRKKPTDEMFEGETSLKSWVSETILQEGGSTLLAMDSNLIGNGSEDVNFSAKEQCVLSVLSLAMDCLKDQPNETINMKDVAARLQKIRTVFLANNGKGWKDKDICQD